MRRVATLVTCGMGCLLLALVLPLQFQAALRAQQPAPGSAQEPFRASADVIQLDVSVLDKNHRPVAGLTAADFTVMENGKPQRIVGVTPIEVQDVDPRLSAWMRLIPRDVSANEMLDIAGEGRLVGILVDDRTLPFDDADTAISVRSTLRHIIDQLAPSDSAAVVFSQDAGLSQDFTSDRTKLYQAIDSYDPARPPLVTWEPRVNGPLQPGADVQQFAPALARSDCLRTHPAVPTLETLVARLAAGPPQQRKTVMYVGIGVPMTFSPGTTCEAELFSLMRNVFDISRHADVMIHTIDPLGYLGYQTYLENPMRAVRGTGPHDIRGGAPSPRIAHDFMLTVAENTGGHHVIDTDAVEPEIDQIFEEASAYYLLGYQTSNGKPDGKYRKVEVKVNRKDLSVRTRSGYWAPTSDGSAKPEDGIAFTPMMQGIAGLTTPAALPLRVAAVPVAHVDGRGIAKDADVAVVLTARVPSPHRPVEETFTITRNVYDPQGRAGPPVREVVTLPLPSAATEQMRFDVPTRLQLAPGRYEIRFNGTSKVADRSGSVFAEVDVPDFSASPLTMTPIVLGAPPDPSAPRTDPLASLVPLVPTTSRSFAPEEKLTAFVRLVQGGSAPPAAATVSVQLLSIADVAVLETTTAMPAERFAAGRTGDYEIDLPIDKLEHGPYVLSITAKLSTGRTARQDLVFSVRPGGQ